MCKFLSHFLKWINLIFHLSYFIGLIIQVLNRNIFLLLQGFKLRTKCEKFWNLLWFWRKAHLSRKICFLLTRLNRLRELLNVEILMFNAGQIMVLNLWFVRAFSVLLIHINSLTVRWNISTHGIKLLIFWLHHIINFLILPFNSFIIIYYSLMLHTFLKLIETLSYSFVFFVNFIYHVAQLSRTNRLIESLTVGIFEATS
jgi:hypothetical protein